MTPAGALLAFHAHVYDVVDENTDEPVRNNPPVVQMVPFAQEEGQFCVRPVMTTVCSVLAVCRVPEALKTGGKPAAVALKVMLGVVPPVDDRGELAETLVTVPALQPLVVTFAFASVHTGSDADRPADATRANPYMPLAVVAAIMPDVSVLVP